MIYNYAGISKDELSALSAELAGRENLLQIMAWNSAVVDVVVQDEFTHDVVIRWRDDLFLVFDAT